MNKDTKQQQLGQFMTPLEVARNMTSLVNTPVEQWVVLDPACGHGNLLIAAAERMISTGMTDVVDRLIGFDIDQSMVAQCRSRLARVIGCNEERLKIFQGDFLTHATGGLFTAVDQAALEKVTVVLANPPYGSNREYLFFEHTSKTLRKGAELIFLVPLAFIDRAAGIEYVALHGRPLGVTTGHAIIRHHSGTPCTMKGVKSWQSNQSAFSVLSGVKLYELGAGHPRQTEETLLTKPFSSESRRRGWIPCLRTGDIRRSGIVLGRLWVNYGDHLAHPKTISRFSGPKIFVRRVPEWSTRSLVAVYDDRTLLCAGDVLIVRHSHDDPRLLAELTKILVSQGATDFLVGNRPSLKHRMSFPKISAKDLNEFLNLFSIGTAPASSPMESFDDHLRQCESK